MKIQLSLTLNITRRRDEPVEDEIREYGGAQIEKADQPDYSRRPIGFIPDLDESVPRDNDERGGL